MTEWLTTKEVAERCRVSERTVQGWRTSGVGPRYYKIAEHCVRYAAADVDEWITSKRTETWDTKHTNG